MTDVVSLASSALETYPAFSFVRVGTEEQRPALQAAPRPARAAWHRAPMKPA